MIATPLLRLRAQLQKVEEMFLNLRVLNDGQCLLVPGIPLESRQCHLCSPPASGSGPVRELSRQSAIQGPMRPPGDWELLMQAGFDDELGTCWSDLGTIYFWIRKDHLSNRNFAGVDYQLQCG